MITVMTKHFMFHIHWITILRFLYFNFFWACICNAFLYDGLLLLLIEVLVIVVVVFIIAVVIVVS
jgi:hypothetical protein